MKLDEKTYTLIEKGNFGRIVLIVGIIGILLSVGAYFADHEHFFHAYLTAFVYWLSLSLGALFFVMLQHLTSAKWSVVVRRLAESVTATLPWMFLLFIPIFLGLHDLYHWSHAEEVAHDELLQWKHPYLNSTFFAVRAVIYFAVWAALAFILHRTSVKQDAGSDDGQIRTMRRVSAGGMVIYALTISFAAFDWLMSLEPHWYSTIFGAYYFAGAFLSSLALLVVLALYLRSRDVLKNTITVEHYHDLGKLMFGFVIFWAYIGYSQYFLQWYGNIPEETFWYLRRWDGPDGTADWEWVSLLLFFGQFVIPFVVLLFRSVKRNFRLMWIMAIWLLILHFVDMYWLVYPNYFRDSAHFSWVDLAAMVGIGGVFLWIFWNTYSAKALVPVSDPRLKESISFVNR
jgi:hypothetical protein